MRPRYRELEQIVGALTEGVILIEPDQRIVFANAAALTMHGVTDLAELGRTVDQYRENFLLTHRNHHPLKPGSYPMERLLSGNAFDKELVQVEPRQWPGEPWVHRLRGLVIRDEAGAPDCLVLIVADVSDQFEAEDRFERTFAANPAPALICRLADQRIIKLNEGFLEMTGYTRGEVIGRTLREVDVLERAERRELALRRLAARRSIPQMEACLTVPNDASRLVIVAGQPLEVDDEPCMLFTFADLEHRRRVQWALEESETRLATLFRLAPVPLVVLRLEGNMVLDVNEAFALATEYRREEIVGRHAGELRLWVDAEAQENFEGGLRTARRVRALEARLRTREGGEMVALVSAEVVPLEGEDCVLCAFQDISSRKRDEAELMRAIEAVMADASWFSQAVIEKLAALRASSWESRALPLAAGAGDLTGREREVLSRMCTGQDDATIAHELGVSRNTVRNHVAALYRKINVNRRGAAIVWARDRGFGDDAPPKRPKRRRV